MKTKYFLLIVMITIFFSCNNEKIKHAELIKKAMQDKTTIQWLDTAFDLGIINQGDKKELKFRCLNTGTKSLVLGDVRAGCGCTIASFSKEEILPGKEGWVTAKFDSRKQCDEVIKSISAPSNATNDSIRTLTFKAKIINCESNDKVVIPHPVSGE